MSVNKILSSLVALVAVLISVHSASAQILIDPQSPFDPGYFDHDLQYFSPGEFSTFGGDYEIPTGWYFNFSRGYFSASRPETSLRPTDADPAWGNRIQAGFMTEEDKGVEFQYMHIEGPNELLLSATTLDGATTVDINDPSNVANFHSIEVNRVFRLEPTDHGSTWELFGGIRYVALTDKSNNLIETQNDMLGPQFGLRWFKRTGRWVLSWEGKAYPAVNWQIFEQANADEFVIAADMRFEAAFSITRDIALVAGAQMIYFGRGIARSNSLTFNDQDMMYAGGTFGVQVNFH